MSFTAEIKDELSRVKSECPNCDVALLSALIRVCGSLRFRGNGVYTVSISTETSSVARTVVRLAHELYNLDTPLTVRRSNLHKARNYLIEITDQEKLENALIQMGILAPGRGLVSGIPAYLVERPCCKAAYLRGVFMAGGFIANPKGDFHLEMAVTGEDYAADIVKVAADLGVTARVNRRRGTFAVYQKSFEEITNFLTVLGLGHIAIAVARVRAIKSVKNDVNRLVNAEMANQARSTTAAAEQIELIEKVEATVGLNKLPPALFAFCQARKAHPELSLRDLGATMNPPLSKSAMYHRLLRLQEYVDTEL